MPPSDPIIVIGAGHNGLAAAVYLARQGLPVLVLERRSTTGGIAATEELIPGFKFNTGFASAAALSPQVVGDLQLESHGYRPLSPKTAIYAARVGRPGFAIAGKDGTFSVQGGGGGEPGSVMRPEFGAGLRRMAGVFASLLPLTPPDLKGDMPLADLWPWARFALELRGLGRRDMMEFIRVLPMSAAEFLDEQLESDTLKGAFAVFATLGSHLGPMGAGTALNLIYQFLGGLNPVFPEGGAGQVSAALERALAAAGGEMHTESRVKKILVEGGAAAGVVLESGESIPARTVVSSADPLTTLNVLCAARHLPVRFNRRLNNIRFRGSTATVHFALDRLPEFGAGADSLEGWITMSPEIAALERAYDAIKYGRIPEKPCLLVSIPSILDPSLAPKGKHTLSAVVRYAPTQLKEGGWVELTRAVTQTISRYAPDFESAVIDQRTLTPVDYARTYGLSEGGWMHGQLGLDQLIFMRPVPGWSQYTTPIRRLYLCGSGTHPGGGISAVPGLNAAREIIKTLS